MQLTLSKEQKFFLSFRIEQCKFKGLKDFLTKELPPVIGNINFNKLAENFSKIQVSSEDESEKQRIINKLDNIFIEMLEELGETSVNQTKQTTSQKSNIKVFDLYGKNSLYDFLENSLTEPKPIIVLKNIHISMHDNKIILLLDLLGN